MPYIQRFPKAKGLGRGREWGQGNGPYRKGQRLSRPPAVRVRHALAVPTQTAVARRWRGADTQTSRRSRQKVDAAGAGRIAAGDTAPAAAAGTHLAAHPLSRRQFATLYLAPWNATPSWSSSSRRRKPSPCLSGRHADHGLEIVAYALKLRQSHLLPAGATPEAQAAQAEAWTAGTAYAALLHDIGKVAVDLHVEYADGTVWHPWHGPLWRPYRFRYRKEREYRLHSAATGLLSRPAARPGIFDWLAGYPDLWAALLYVLAGQYEHAGTLGELVVQADQASVAQELGGDPSKALAAPGTPCSASCSTACVSCCGGVQAEPAPGFGRLADPGCAVAGEQDRLGQTARPSAAAGHRRHPGQQHGGVQRAAGSRHRLAHAGRQGDLEGHRSPATPAGRTASRS